MHRATDNTAEIFEFPYDLRRSKLYATLDKFVISELAEVIGFSSGAFVLHKAGILCVGDLIALSESQIEKIGGIGPRRLERIKAYLSQRGLALGSPHKEWASHRQQRVEQQQRIEPLRAAGLVRTACVETAAEDTPEAEVSRRSARRPLPRAIAEAPHP
jgi:hypothetical protein